MAALRETPTVSAHLHVPLQSGDDQVLRAMGRRYSSSTYLRRVGPLTDFNLTTDVIVGFPGEDEAAFERTLDLVASAGITKVHVFPYSPRPGTGTAAEDTVPREVKKERGARLRAASHAACMRSWRDKLGSERRRARRSSRARLRRRLLAVVFSPAEAPVGEVSRARARAVTEDGIVGVL